MPPRKSKDNHRTDERELYAELDRMLDEAEEAEELDDMIEEADHLMATRQFEMAIVQFQEILQKDPYFPPALDGLLNALQKLYQHQEVVSYCSALDAKGKRLTVDRAAQSMITLKMYSDAIELIERELNSGLDEYTHPLYELLAEAYDALGNGQKANEVKQRAGLEKSICEIEDLRDEILSMSLEPHLRLSRLAEKLATIQDYRGAVEAIREAIVLNPNDPKYRFRLADYERKKFRSIN